MKKILKVTAIVIAIAIITGIAVCMIIDYKELEVRYAWERNHSYELEARLEYVFNETGVAAMKVYSEDGSYYFRIDEDAVGALACTWDY